jgi:hypothetical protein
MSFWVARDGDPNAQLRGNFPLGNRVCGVVGSLGVDVGTQFAQERLDIWLVENQDVVHGFKSGDKLGASAFGENGTAGTFQAPLTGIGIDSDDEDIAFAPGSGKVTDVADVEHVKTSIGKDDALARSAKRFELMDEPGTIENF